MSRLTPVVLVVDDDSDTRDLYELALPFKGLPTMVASNVDQAAHYIATLNPDVIVTDLSLEGSADGYELIRQQRGRPVIVLTAWSDAEHLARAHQAGATVVLVKPCTPDDLAATIRSVLAWASS
jgi:DNA-binding response OmpR family regulator